MEQHRETLIYLSIFLSIIIHSFILIFIKKELYKLSNMIEFHNNWLNRLSPIKTYDKEKILDWLFGEKK